MTDNEIRNIVKLTVEELTQRQLLRQEPKYTLILKEMDKRFYAFFQKNKHDGKLHRALVELSDDPYIDIIYLHYRDEMTLANIAEIMERDDRTIKRNKKRLVKLIFQMLTDD